MIFASYAACREEHRSCAAEPSCSSSASTTVVQEPQASLNPQQEGEQQAPGSIAGTITDPTGAPVPRAVAKLTCAGQTLLPQAVTDEDGRFVFLDVAPGEFRLTISAEGFQTLEVSGTVHPDEHYLAAPITLSIAEQVTQITVTPNTEEEVAERQIKAQEMQRVLGFVPHFYVSYVSNAAPLTFKQKMELAWKASVDPITIGGVGIGAELSRKETGTGHTAKERKDMLNDSARHTVMLPTVCFLEARSCRRYSRRIRATSTRAQEDGVHGSGMRSAGR